MLGGALAIVLVGRAPSLGDFHTLFGWQIALALATAVLCAPVDTRPRQ